MENRQDIEMKNDDRTRSHCLLKTLTALGTDMMGLEGAWKEAGEQTWDEESSDDNDLHLKIE
jgi:hypothetical protein